MKITATIEIDDSKLNPLLQSARATRKEFAEAVERDMKDVMSADILRDSKAKFSIKIEGIAQ